MYLAFRLFVPLFFEIHIFLSIFISHVVSTVVSEPPNVTSLIEARAPASFKHPGVLLDLHRLNHIRSHVKAKNDPWKKAFDALLHSSFGSLNRRAHPRANVECGFYSVPNFGCLDEIHDALSAYAVSLLWFITGEKKYAQKSIYYMNAWSKVIRSHGNKNAQVQAGWASASWAKAAEIIRHTNGGWATKDVQRFEAMLRNAYLPPISKGAPPGYNGNWELVMIEAMQGIAIFLDDHQAYDAAMTRFLDHVPAYIYLRSDGQYPKVAPGHNIHTPKQIQDFWHGQKKFWADGICQETCRDFSHSSSGISSIAHVIETSLIQGINLYDHDVGLRLQHALEFHTHQEQSGETADWLCKGRLIKGFAPVTEVGFNGLAIDRGRYMPNTKSFTKKKRPAYTNFLDQGFETLTHAKKKI